MQAHPASNLVRTFMQPQERGLQDWAPFREIAALPLDESINF